jgi:DNA-binding NarL/FixJ family response regulator
VAVRVLLVEDNDVYRSALELLLGLQAGLEVVGSVASGAEAAGAARDLAPDVVVMDYRLPGLDGAAATRAVIEASGAAVVCLTAEATVDERGAVLDAGAVGALADAIRAAASADGA